MGFVDMAEWGVMPTLALYMKELGADPRLFGFALSAMMLSKVLAGPVIGYLSTRIGFQKSYAVTIVAGIVAGVMYTAARMFEPHTGLVMILCARVLQGFGASNTVMAKAHMQIVMAAKGAEDAAGMAGVQQVQKLFKHWIMIFTACKMSGMTIGPALDIFVNHADFYIGPLHVTAINIQGLFISILLVLVGLPLLYNLQELEADEDERNEPSQKTPKMVYTVLAALDAHSEHSAMIAQKWRARIDRNSLARSASGLMDIVDLADLDESDIAPGIRTRVLGWAQRHSNHSGVGDV